MKYDIVIVGGGPGGYTACLEAKRFYPAKNVLMIRRDEPLIIPCAIPYVCSTLCSLNKDVLSDEPLKKANVEILTDEVVDINREDKIIVTRNQNRIKYDKIILATGSVSKVPLTLKTDLKNVFVISKKYEYVKKCTETINNSNKVAIIGGGVCGIEFADDISISGKDVSIIEVLPDILLLNFDKEFASIAREKLTAKGVKIYNNARVVGYKGKNGLLEYIKLDDGREIAADTAIITIGVKPNSKLAAKIGLKIAENGAIYVDGYMRTSDPNIFAVGDCALKKDLFTGLPSPYMLASIAAYEARVAVQSLYKIGYINPNIGVTNILLTNVGGCSLGAVGLTENIAKKLGYKYISSTYECFDVHPSTMPSASKIKIKLLFSDENMRLIGAQLAGGKSIAEMVNLLIYALYSKATAYDLYLFIYGTQPYLTASPIAYPIVNVASKVLAEKTYLKIQSLSS